MRIESAEFTMDADFTVSTSLDDVREAIREGAIRIDGEPAEDVLARLEASERGELQTVVFWDGAVVATLGLDDAGRAVRRSGHEGYDLDSLWVGDADGQITKVDGARWLRALPIAFAHSTHIGAEVVEPR